MTSRTALYVGKVRASGGNTHRDCRWQSSGVRIDINVIIEGECEFGDHVEIGAGCIIKNTKIAAGTKVQPYSIFDNAMVGEYAQIGPFARLRPGAKLAAEVHIGNFVEVKNTSIGFGSKANHFTYLGDAEIGAGSNIGDHGWRTRYLSCTHQ